jgi:SNF2 family DNA or RNA helicase
MSEAGRSLEGQAFDPRAPGQVVRLRDNPGRRGTTTGRTKKAGSFLLVEVDFGPNEKQFKRFDLLESVENDEEMVDQLARGQFGGPIDLRRVLTLEKIRGDLTNVFYSMEASKTKFFAHQFRPVLKFIESPIGRILIADEVGLGKTIESVYMWKELQARQDARRLLVVCPAMLRDKWRSDLKNRFNIVGNKVSTSELLEMEAIPSCPFAAVSDASKSAAAIFKRKAASHVRCPCRASNR